MDGRNTTYVAVSAGETIKELLTDRKMGLKELGDKLNLQEREVAQLINGDIVLTESLAKKLEVVFGISENFWIILEKKYRLTLDKILKEKAE